MAPAGRQPDALEFDCQRCGACCIGLDVLLLEAEVDAFERDARLRPLLREHPRVAALPLYFMRRDPRTDRCTALAGPQHACRCTIYAQRPTLCRALEAGSEPCREARRKAGFPA